MLPNLTIGDKNTGIAEALCTRKSGHQFYLFYLGDFPCGTCSNRKPKSLEPGPPREKTSFMGLDQEPISPLPSDAKRWIVLRVITMPSVCCVPGCKSNYPPTTENVRVFKFPNEADLKDQWLRKIPRKDFTPTARSVVCVKHFKNDDVIKEDIITLPDGCEEVRARKRFKLKSKAIPSISPNLPSYLSDINTNSLPSRKDPEMRRESELQRSKKKNNRISKC
ncbi:hypothetical protein AVEN_74434-1 [Araneus ventricosus]|uniref:THAP-type domain-containing protein n=1 Tax=Araneus ventricosus TaxID=182803 RepID=A0A4Y2MLN0_ARAVE|nr:hypothetical protein AVEN_74434-1 [Araneus ventricosus]